MIGHITCTNNTSPLVVCLIVRYFMIIVANNQPMNNMVGILQTTFSNTPLWKVLFIVSDLTAVCSVPTVPFASMSALVQVMAEHQWGGQGTWRHMASLIWVYWNAWMISTRDAIVCRTVGPHLCRLIALGYCYLFVDGATQNKVYLILSYLKLTRVISGCGLFVVSIPSEFSAFT